MAHQIEISSLDLRYESHRMRNTAIEGKLLSSIAERGIEEALEGVDLSGRPVLLNGFKRLRCAKRLRLTMVPYVSLGEDVAQGIVYLLRVSNEKSLTLLEQAAFVDELKTLHRMTVAQIAESLSRSKAWVSVRHGLMGEMTARVRELLFRGDFPVYCYMYSLRPFRRLNKISAEGIEEFIVAVSGRNLSVRQIERLAHAFFCGPESLQEEIRRGNLDLPLSGEEEASGCTAVEQSMLRDLEIVQKYMQRVTSRSGDRRLKSASFHAQAHLLSGGVLRRSETFLERVREIHDRSGEATSGLPSPSRGDEPAGDCPTPGDQPGHGAGHRGPRRSGGAGDSAG